MKRQTNMIAFALIIAILVISTMTPQHVIADPGNVIISGQVTYQPRNWDPLYPNWRTGSEMMIDLYEMDLQGHDHYLDTTYTDSNGYFTFPSRTNWWAPDNSLLNFSSLL